MISTEAWVLRRGGPGGGTGPLIRESLELGEPEPDELLVRPLYGCWEGNMEHALQRRPIDVCALRDEDRVVLGNAGVVEVIRAGSAIDTVQPGDLGMVFCNGTPDRHGYPITIFGYDAPGTVGVLAKLTKLRRHQFLPIPERSRFAPGQWAAFSLRYVTAWANWRVAYACWRAQAEEASPDQLVVVAWGGGVSLAQLTLARALGHRAVMIASRPQRLQQLRALGLETIDRDALRADHFEADLLEAVRAKTDGHGASIFIDNLGMQRTTLKALAREGVIATCGWKHGAVHTVSRAMECINRHIHVHTHYARYAEGVDAVRFALEHGWMPPADGPVYAWDDVPRLADDYAHGRIDSYFPLFCHDERGR